MQHSLLPSADLNPTAYTPIKSTKNSIDSVRDFGQSDMQKKSGGLKKSELWTSKSLVFLHLDDHRPCTTGFCMHGVCQASKANLILRFWGLYDKVSDNALGELYESHSVLLYVFSPLIASDVYVYRRDGSAKLPFLIG